MYFNSKPKNQKMDYSINIKNNSRLIKTFTKGVYKEEPQNGAVYSRTINYGGSGELFDNLKHELALDNGANVIISPAGTNDVPDSVIDSNDGHSNSDQFATRGQAIQKLYEKAGYSVVGYADWRKGRFELREKRL